MNIRIKPLLSALFVAGIWILIIAAGIFAAEYYSKSVLQKEGWLPPDGSELTEHSYAYQANGFTVRLNTPNYRWSAYDENFKSQRDSLWTDENGFVTGGVKLKEEKDSGVIRIFLTGGSTAWGSLQTGNLMDSISYPEGSYIYDASIAGRLLRALEQRHPNLKFEVINAAVVGFTLAQDKALYEYKLHNFNPDVIINLDGYNDVSVFTSPLTAGDPYAVSDKQWEEDMQLSVISRSIIRPYTFMLLNIRHQQYKKRKKEWALAQQLPKGFKPSKDKTNVAAEPDIEKYKLMEPAFVYSSQKLLYVVNSYLCQLKADKVHSIFCLQPLLSTRINQKALSPLEFKMRTHFEKVTVADTIKMAAFTEVLKHKVAAAYLNPMLAAGAQRFEAGSYCKAFFYQQYLAPQIDSLAKLNGQSFIDIASHMKGIGAETEFYTDYCHLTPYGNEFVAGLMADEVDKFLVTKAH